MEPASMTQLVNPSVSVIQVSVAVTVAFQIALPALMVSRAVMFVLVRTVSMERPVSMLRALLDRLMLPALTQVYAVAMVCAHPVHATALQGGAAMTVPLPSVLVLAAVTVFARKVANVNANLDGMEMTAAELVVQMVAVVMDSVFRQMTTSKCALVRMAMVVLRAIVQCAYALTIAKDTATAMSPALAFVIVGTLGLTAQSLCVVTIKGAAIRASAM